MGFDVKKSMIIIMKSQSEIDEILSKIYYDLEDKASLSGFVQLNNEVKKRKLGIKSNNIKKWLMKQEVYTLHRQRKLRFPRLKYHPVNIDDVWSIDLMDMQNISRFNYAQRYILAVVDNFSRFAWCIPKPNNNS